MTNEHDDDLEPEVIEGAEIERETFPEPDEEDVEPETPPSPGEEESEMPDVP